MKVNFDFNIVKFPECEIIETAHRSYRHFNVISKSNVFLYAGHKGQISKGFEIL